MAISKTQPMRSAEIDLIDAYNEIIEDIPTLETTIETLIEEVGDENSGLVKEVNDLDTTVNGIESAIGDENSGLVKYVDDLQSDVTGLENIVGDSTSGLVKDVNDLESDLTLLSSIIGDNSNGLIHDVSALQHDVSENSDDIYTMQHGSVSLSTETKNYSYYGSAAYVVISRGANGCIYIFDYFGANPIVIGTALSDITIAKQAVSRDFSITNAGNSKSILLSSNAYEVEVE